MAVDTEAEQQAGGDGRGQKLTVVIVCCVVCFTLCNHCVCKQSARPITAQLLHYGKQHYRHTLTLPLVAHNPSPSSSPCTT